MKTIYIEAENILGVLRRVAGVFDKKGLNIETIEAHPLKTGDNKTAITITLDITEKQELDARKLLNRLYDIELVEGFAE